MDRVYADLPAVKWEILIYVRLVNFAPTSLVNVIELHIVQREPFVRREAVHHESVFAHQVIIVLLDP
jgi:hypothetical protein